MSRVLWARLSMECKVTEEEFAEVLDSLHMTEEEFLEADDVNFTDVLSDLFMEKGTESEDSYVVGYVARDGDEVSCV